MTHAPCGRKLQGALGILALIVSGPLHAQLLGGAREAAQKFISKRVQSTCGPDSFSISHYHLGLESSRRAYEYKGFSWLLSEVTPRDVDRQNGIEWLGQLTITARSYREFGNYIPVEGTFDREGWSDWKEFPSKPLRVAVQKRRGVWRFEIDRVGGEKVPIYEEAPSCQEVNELLKLPVSTLRGD